MLLMFFCVSFSVLLISSILLSVFISCSLCLTNSCQKKKSKYQYMYKSILKIDHQKYITISLQMCIHQLLNHHPMYKEICRQIQYSNSILISIFPFIPQLSQFPLFQIHVTFQYFFLKILMFAAPPEIKTNNILNYFMVQTNNIIQ